MVGCACGYQSRARCPGFLQPLYSHVVVAHASVETYVSSSCQTVVNALLSLRDHAILKLSARHRRITASLLLGKTQVEIARVEKLSQQAISDFARGTGAGLIQSSLLIAEATRA